MIAAGVWYC